MKNATIGGNQAREAAIKAGASVEDLQALNATLDMPLGAPPPPRLISAKPNASSSIYFGDLQPCRTTHTDTEGMWDERRIHTDTEGMWDERRIHTDTEGMWDERRLDNTQSFL